MSLTSWFWSWVGRNVERHYEMGLETHKEIWDSASWNAILGIVCRVHPDGADAMDGFIHHWRENKAGWFGPHRAAGAWLHGELRRLSPRYLPKGTVSDRDIRGGEPVLFRTRFPLAQVLQQLAEGDTITEIAHDFDLDVEKLRAVITDLANHYVGAPP